MEIDAYLKRIGLPERPPANLAGLTALHRAHLRAIPFEDLDVQLRRPISIDPPAIYDKLVTRRRGGWCYEMNGLLGWALGELGFAVTRVTGGVMREVRGPAAEGNHLVLRVDLEEGTWLADVGFGHGPHDPFRLEAGPFEANGFPFALARVDGEWWRLEDRVPGSEANYDVHPHPADEALLARQCEFLQTAEQSPFVQNLVCQRQFEGETAVLRGRVLKHVHPDGSDTRLLENERELVAVLGDLFGLDVPEVAGLWPVIVARHAVLFDEPGPSAA